MFLAGVGVGTILGALGLWLVAYVHVRIDEQKEKRRRRLHENIPGRIEVKHTSRDVELWIYGSEATTVIHLSPAGRQQLVEALDQPPPPASFDSGAVH